MRIISHQVKSYRRRFRPIPGYVIKSSIFVLTATLAVLLTGAVVASVLEGLVLHSAHYSFLPSVVLLCEIPLVFGFLQLYIESHRRRYLRARPGASEPGFRVALMTTEREKRVAIDELFGPQENFDALAGTLIERWEWHRAIAEKSGDPIVKKAWRFFSFPAAGNFATYIGGLLAVVAAIVVTTLDKDVFYAQLPQMWNDVVTITWLLTRDLVFPLAVVVIPFASIVGTLRSLAVRARERIDDDYLSQASFYAFVEQLLEMEELRTRRLLMVSTGFAYWTIRLGIVPLQDLPKLRRNMKRSKRLKRMHRERAADLSSVQR